MSNPEPARFVISSMDGTSFDADAMRVWMDDAGIAGSVDRVSKDNRPLLVLYEQIGLRRTYVIAIPDPDHAVIWRLRWGEDEIDHDDHQRQVEIFADQLVAQFAQYAQAKNECILASIKETTHNCMLDSTDTTKTVAPLGWQLGFTR